MQKLIANKNQNRLLENDLKSVSQFKKIEFKSFDFKSVDFISYPTLTTDEVAVLKINGNLIKRSIYFVVQKR